LKKQNKETFKSLKSSLAKNSKILIICSSNSEIEDVFEELSDLVNEKRLVRFYDREILPYDHFSTPDDVIKKRFDEIQNIYDARLVISSLKNLFEFYPRQNFYKSLKEYKNNEELSISEIKEILESLNYKRVEKVSSLNEYSHRGGIVDINSSRYKNPIRLDFFGDCIESIREFDIKTQRSINEIKSFKLNSGYEIPLNEEIINEFKDKWRNQFPLIDERDSIFFNSVAKNKLPDGYENYLSILINDPINFFDLVKCDSTFITSDSNIDDYKQFIIDRFNDENNGTRELISPEKLFFDVTNRIKDENPIKMISNSKTYEDKFKNRDFNNTKNKGTNHLIYDNSLNINDLVIHEDYGLGIFEGLKTIKTSSKENEYLCIRYKDNELLYVPTFNFNLLSKFHKKTDNTSLDSLSNTNWSSKKEKAKARIYDHASEILKIESDRLRATSSALKVSDNEYSSFINDFPFNDTKDQEIVSKEIRKDLSLIKPMNRLLCGDVGFGKTEIAMRASFISALSDKQTIILSPSTVLTDQHFESFSKRFKNFPITIEKLSRNSSHRVKEKLYKDFKNKKIDILIGTHALFNEDLSFENVGLLVVDEEHRFGAKQKNLIKNKQLSTHILFMSATPIPKTMNMAFSGLKDFSFLSTPPPKRLSIKTFLEVSNNTIIKESLTREFNRNGCTFVIENDIQKMNKIKNNLEALVPNQKIDIVHASLNKKLIDKRLNDFRNRKINVLICTTIVEMGLDIPEANTIIINNAQNFGLSQLHQLRGRIGRSSKQGYCYVLIPSSDINNKSKSRLQSFIKNSHLGAGFNIANEDLEIRGAGEILGVKQSGHIDTIGMSLYMSMLKTALNNDHIEINQSCEIKVSVTSLIPEYYLPSPTERLKIYRKLSAADSKTLNEIKVDLLDRCGKHPTELENLFRITKISIKAKSLGITKIVQSSKYLKLKFSKTLKDKTLSKILNIASENLEIYEIKKNGELWINYNGQDVLNLVDDAIQKFS
jgi:transcription-repair coupling factor (superfamily II helicase)